MKPRARPRRRTVDVIRVFRSPGDGRRGLVRVGPIEIRCALGKAGPVRRKREGDGGTPLGRYPILGGFYRSDRLARPFTLLPLRPIRPDHGWCDDPRSPAYNRLVLLPARASHERMWRDDNLYDVVLDLGWNRRPLIKGRGSAIFLHVARPGFTGTEGCVAIARNRLIRVLAWIGPATAIEVRG